MIAKAETWKHERETRERTILTYSIAALASQAFAGSMPSLESLLDIKPTKSEKPLLDDAKLQQLDAFKTKVQKTVRKTNVKKTSTPKKNTRGR